MPVPPEYETTARVVVEADDQEEAIRVVEAALRLVPEFADSRVTFACGKAAKAG